MRECLKHPVFEIIADVIGGYVRDLLIGRPSSDIDIVVLGNGIDLHVELRCAGRQRKSHKQNRDLRFADWNATQT